LYSKLGTVYSSLDSFNIAETYFLKGLNIAEVTGDIYNLIVLQTELAHDYFLQGKYSDASQLLTKAQIIASKYDLSQILGLQDLYWGKIYSAANNYKLADAKLLKAVELSESVKDFSTLIEACYLLGKNFEAMDDLAQAEFWYLKSVNLIEQISRPLSMNQEIQISHFSGLNDVFNSLVELYLKMNDEEKAFLTIEKSRSRNTKINLDKLKLFTEIGNEDIIDKLSDLEWMVSSGLYEQPVIDSLQKEISDLKGNLISKNKNLNQILGGKHTYSLKELQTKLSEKDYLVSVYISDKFLTLFDLNKNDLSSETIALDRDSLISLLGSISPIYKSEPSEEELYVNEDLFSFNAYYSYKMYKKIFEKFLSGIPKESNLIVNVPPELLKLPLELLITQWNEEESPYVFRDKKFLLDDYKISYTPSASIYCIQMEKQQVNNHQNLLVGDPYINNSELTLSVRSGLIETTSSQARNIRLYPLKYSADEIKGIDATMDNNMIFLSQHATESNFKRYAPMCNIVHISSHSFLIKDQPLVLFSAKPNDIDDGFLELGEIVQLKLNSDLVVLSSCRSGLGRMDEAEGIVGMQKAFFEAGCNSVLVSLWDVNDKFTSYFMKDFYKHIAEGMSKSEALRNTKKEFIRKYSANPYYWSAFVLSGNPSGIKVQEASTFHYMPIILIVLVSGLLYVAFIRIRKYF
jgi:CHAT domain-containing protein